MAPIALTIAGSDSGGGAGIQADLKSFSAFGVFGCSVITAVTAQNTVDVTDVHPIPVDTIIKQIEAVLDDIRVDAIKIGMLGAPETVECVCRAIAAYEGPVVLDPVMVAKSGASLLPDSAVAALRDNLVPRATVLTPNIPEAAHLLETDTQMNAEGLRSQGCDLLNMGPQAVLMKGEHGEDDTCTDWLITKGGEQSFEAGRIDTRNTHGTGCSYSYAIAAGLTHGHPVEQAVSQAHRWLHQAIVRADELDVGNGHGPVHHFHEVWK